MPRKAYWRDEVLATAMQTFWETGYQGTTVGDLCTATGLNRKSLYSEFTDKSSLFVEAVRLYTGGAIEQTRAVLAAEPRGPQNIRRYFRAMRYGPDCRGCLMTMTANERSLAPEVAVETVRRTLREIEGLFRDNLRAGGLDEQESLQLAAFLVFSIQGITTMGKLDGDDTKLESVVGTILGVLPAE